MIRLECTFGRRRFLSSPLATSRLQRHFGVCAFVRTCVGSSVRPDLSGSKLLCLWMDFRLIWHNCSSESVNVQFEGFIQVGHRWRSHGLCKFGTKGTGIFPDNWIKFDPSRFMKTLRKKEKLLVTSNFSFSLNVFRFYRIWNFPAIFFTDLDPYSPTILENILCLVVQIFLYSEAFECNHCSSHIFANHSSEN